MDENPNKEAWSKAIQLLSRREYSYKELSQKLARSVEGADLDSVLQSLEEEGYLSDQRFCESFVRMRVGQGHGLIRIRFDLKQKGIASELLASCLEDLDIDWFVQAEELYRRKYREPLAGKDFKERSKRMRFMSQRGFSIDEIQFAIEQVANDEY
ncbi:regulatory protein RecX [Neptuniibacter sp. PT8_73]|uniref:regulatory protein RecX n=1 Tax=unclassified Neptuniibacter TaxID=2630693 RepID=UPI0039F7064B